MRKQNWITLLIFFGVSVAILLIASAADNSCPVLNHYNFESTRIGDLWNGLLSVTLIPIAGVLLFVLIKRYVKSGYLVFKYCYFAILPVIIFRGLILTIPQALSTWGINQAICSKSKDNGQNESKGLSLSEYNYMVGELRNFPNLPKSAANIDVSYYTDPFLGDFMINIYFTCNASETIKADNNHWFIIKRDPSGKTMRVNYTDFDN